MFLFSTWNILGNLHADSITNNYGIQFNFSKDLTKIASYHREYVQYIPVRTYVQYIENRRQRKRHVINYASRGERWSYNVVSVTEGCNSNPSVHYCSVEYSAWILILHRFNPREYPGYIKVRFDPRALYMYNTLSNITWILYRFSPRVQYTM